MRRAIQRRAAEYWFSVGALIAAASCALPLANAAESLPEGFKKCSAYHDRDARLDCFDAEVARLSNPQAAKAGPAQTFGVTGSVLAQQQARQNTQPSEVTARVTAVSTRARGERVVTLDNGQVWEQTQGTSFPVKVDDTVTIKAGALSSYVLVAASGKTTKVTRIK